MRNKAILGLLFAMILTPLAAPAWAVNDEPPETADDMSPLIERSDLIALAHVIELRPELNKTNVKLTVDEVYKGPADLKQIELQHGGGKHLVAPNEPVFKSYDKAILYLQKGPDGVYRCVDGAQGMKQILNDNVYVVPGNFFASTPFKKYRKLLTDRLAAQGSTKPAGTA